MHVWSLLAYSMALLLWIHCVLIQCYRTVCIYACSYMLTAATSNKIQAPEETVYYSASLVNNYTIVTLYMHILVSITNHSDLICPLPKQDSRNNRTAWFGWSLWPHQGLWNIPVPASKETLYWRLVGLTSLKYAGEHTYVQALFLLHTENCEFSEHNTSC